MTMTWWLERAARDDVDGDEPPRYYMMINGERARSVRTKEIRGHVVAVQHSKKPDYVQVVFDNLQGTEVPIDNMVTTTEFPTKDIRAVIEGFAAAANIINVIPDSQPSDSLSVNITDSVSLDSQPEFSQDTQRPQISQPTPLLSSTPISQAVRPSQIARKRRRDHNGVDKENSFSVEAKCKGQYKVGVSQLMKAPEGMLARKVSDDGIGAIKTVLRDNQPRQLPVIPVMATGRWNGNVSSQDKFIVLAGYPLYMAAKDLSTDGKFEDYRQLDVLIYCDVDTEEIHQVEALFGLQASLLQDGGESLESRVASFREILYRICGTDRQDEPPKPRQKITAQWRRMCAASVGKSTERCAMKALEPTFQIAQYSNRCYEKVSRIFQIEREKGKEVKQSIFLPLQGLNEGERFTILSGAVSGDIALKDIKAAATTKKLLQDLKKEMIHQLGASSWEEVEEEYPFHSTEDVLKPYRGLDFKKSLPRSFIKLVDAAKKWKEAERDNARTDMAGNLQFVRRVRDAGCRTDLAFISIREDSDITEMDFQSRTVLVYICENVMLAARTMEFLEGKQHHRYSVLINKEVGKVQHVVATVWRPDGILESPPLFDPILALSDFFSTAVERLTSTGEAIMVCGPVTDAVVAAVRLGRRAITVTECSEVEEQIRMMVVQPSVSDDSDPYEYDDN